MFSWGQWFPSYDLQTASISITWELVRNANSQGPPQPTVSEMLGVREEAQWRVFNKSSRKILMHDCIRSLCPMDSGLFFSWHWLDSLLPRGFCSCCFFSLTPFFSPLSNSYLLFFFLIIAHLFLLTRQTLICTFLIGFFFITFTITLSIFLGDCVTIFCLPPTEHNLVMAM